MSQQAMSSGALTYGCPSSSPSISSLRAESCVGSAPIRAGASLAMPTRAPSGKAGRYAEPRGQNSPYPTMPESVSTETTVESKTATDLPPEKL